MSLNEILKAWNSQSQAPHLIIEARAGTGKTTTLIEGLRIILGEKPNLDPSPQQAVIWAKMRTGPQPKSICFTAFNRSIATELQGRVPRGCNAMTMHSMGFRAVRKRFDSVKVNQYRVRDIIGELLGMESWELRKKKPGVLQATEKLIGLCKMNLTGWRSPTKEYTVDAPDWQQDLSNLSSHYDVDLNGYSTEVFALVPRILERCKDVDRDRCIDFNDMIWLPIVLDLPIWKYDLLLVDEAQDLNCCRQELAIKAGKRLILCGDPKQAIYGFAGADSESMGRMQQRLSRRIVQAVVDNKAAPICQQFYGMELDEENAPPHKVPGGFPPCRCVVEEVGCQRLPLTVTFRCGKAIVKEAQRYVPDFEAHESNHDGAVSNAVFRGGHANGAYHEDVQDGDMILCRVNAPLVSECFRFLRQGRRAEIQGRDVGQGLISTIQRLMKDAVVQPLALPNATTLSAEMLTLGAKLHDWLYLETKKENLKQNPSENQLIALQDRYDCLGCFMEDMQTVDQVIARIEEVFTDNKKNVGIKLSSVHKAKGLEAQRVFILQPENAGMPHPMAKSPWQLDQEYNLIYVAITRAIEELVYVS